MEQVTKRDALSALPRRRLLTLARQFSVDAPSSTRKQELVNRLTRSRSLSVDGLIHHLDERERAQIVTKTGRDLPSAANPVEEASQRAAALRETSTRAHKKQWGQYFTPVALGEFMASLVELGDLGQEHEPLRILDPGAGTGIVGLSLVLRALREHPARPVELVAIEPEPGARDDLQHSLSLARRVLGPRFSFSVLDEDVLELATPRLAPAPFHVAVANPPYFKMTPSDPRGGDAPNIYARFMEVSSKLLHPGGCLCFIVPRSFASGYYFRRFRLRFHQTMQLRRVHVFGSRADAFRGDEVLQENTIVVYSKQRGRGDHDIAISCSRGLRDLDDATCMLAPDNDVIGTDTDAVISLPTSTEELHLLRAIRRWPQTLATLGLQVSTGPIVPFRATEHLVRAPEVDTVPLLWLQHVSADGVAWPLGERFRKQEYVRSSIGAKALVANQNCVLLRRFSAKEDRRRLTAAAYLADDFDYPTIGLENHLNCIHRPGGMSDTEVIGLTALLGSETLDRYFRISSGNTQVSATELRVLPLPGLAVIHEIAGVSLRDGARAVERVIEENLAEQAR